MDLKHGWTTDGWKTAENEKKSSKPLSLSPSRSRLLSSPLLPSNAAKHFQWVTIEMIIAVAVVKNLAQKPQGQYQRGGYAEQREKKINKQTCMRETVRRFSRVDNIKSSQSTPLQELEIILIFILLLILRTWIFWNAERVRSPSLRYWCIFILQETTSNRSKQARVTPGLRELVTTFA